MTRFPKLWSFVDDLADGRITQDVSGASGRVSVRNVFQQAPTKVDGIRRIPVQQQAFQILPDNVPDEHGRRNQNWKWSGCIFLLFQQRW